MDDLELLDVYSFEEPAVTLEEQAAGAELRRGRGRLYNLLTLIFLGGAAGVAVFVVAMLRNPQFAASASMLGAGSALSQFGLAGAVTETAVPAAAPTDAPTAAPTETPLPTPTQHPAFVPPATAVPPAATRRPTELPQVTATDGAVLFGAVRPTPSPYLFAAVEGSPAFRAHDGPEKCDYLGVRGTVVDMDGKPVVGIPIVVEGDELFESLVLSGSAPAVGPGGYTVQLGEWAVEAEFTVQLWSDTGFRISEPVTFKTRDSCEHNLVLVDFVATQPLD